MRFFGHFASDQPTKFGRWLTKKTVARQFAFLQSLIPHDREINILEGGPGRGEFAAEFLKAGYTNYSVIEPDDGLRAICELLPIRRAYAAMIPPFPVENSSHDLIIMCDVFEHMNDTTMAISVLAEVKRVLRPGGFVFILCPDFLHWKEDFFNCDFSHSNPTTVRRTNQMFENIGIQTIAFEYHYNYFSGPFGFLIGSLVKAATTPFKRLGANNASRIYRLRLCFLRRFLLLGRLA